jgi:hypothetical protein
MINNPVFFVRDVVEYAEFTRFQAAGSQFGYFFQPRRNPLAWKLRELRLGIGITKWPPKELLGTQFHSMTAYRLGASNNVKYSARPVACEASQSVPDGMASFGWSGLKAGLESALKNRPACFDFMVQLQRTDQNMPVEDPTVEWLEKDSPFIPVARVVIDKQDIRPETQNYFCENLSMTPWHALPEHEPIGGLNRVRKAVYQGISRYRRCLNGSAFGEPRLDGSPQFDTKVCDPHAPVPLIPGP